MKTIISVSDPSTAQRVLDGDLENISIRRAFGIFKVGAYVPFLQIFQISSGKSDSDLSGEFLNVSNWTKTEKFRKDLKKHLETSAAKDKKIEISHDINFETGELVYRYGKHIDFGNPETLNQQIEELGL